MIIWWTIRVAITVAGFGIALLACVIASESPQHARITTAVVMIVSAALALILRPR